jgi:hypothetical protein
MRLIEIYFVRDYKKYVESFGKKAKSEYVLNINKLIHDKLDTDFDFVVPNPIQSFLLNYEIKKLIDKVINIKNKKYTRVIYQNYNLDYNVAASTLKLLQDSYPEITFDPFILEEADHEFSDHKSGPIKIIEVA